MPQIVPISHLKNTSEISEMCHSAREPIFITKNGYGDMVIMSMENYEKTKTMSAWCAWQRSMRNWKSQNARWKPARQ